MTDLAHAYDDDRVGARRPSVSRVERAQICDLLDQIGPDAQTLLPNWDARHLAAHLRLRESTPIGTLTSATPKISDRAVERLAARSDYRRLVEEIRNGPPRLSIFGLDRTDRDFNTLEFFVHHEDVRRAEAGWVARLLPRWAEDEIWLRTRAFARMLLRRQPVGIVLARTDSGETCRAVREEPAVVLRGKPSDLALYAYGRWGVARVEFDGPADVVQRLQRKTS